jgi:hypothetical protein
MKRWMVGVAFLFAVPAFASRVEIHEGRFFVDGLPFYVNAVAYGPWRPHQLPGTSYTDTNRRIKAAHFNTIRTWESLDPESLALAKAHGLMVLQGIRMDPRQDFSDPHNLETAAEQVRRVAEKTKDADNILGYLIMSRADPASVLNSGLEESRQFFRRLQRTIQTIDPRPVALERWWPVAFLDDPDSDFGAFSAFAFWPQSLTFAMGYPNLVQWLVDHQSKDKPFILTETGGYSVSQASATESGGLGGFTEYNQSLKDIESLRGTVQGHAQGAALVSWTDNWYFPRDADTHDNEPWEWTGILGIATDSKKDMDGVPRIALADLKTYNQLTPVEPKADHFYPVQVPIPIRVFGSPETVGMRMSLNGGDWTRLQGSGQGLYVGSFKLPKLARRRQRLSLQALDKDDSAIAQKDISFIAALDPETVRVALDGAARGSQKFSFHVVVRNGDGQPIAQRKVYFGCFYPVSAQQAQGTIVTDAAGLASFSCAFPSQEVERYLYAAAGTDSLERVRTGDLHIFSLSK